MSDQMIEYQPAVYRNDTYCPICEKWSTFETTIPSAIGLYGNVRVCAKCVENRADGYSR